VLDYAYVLVWQTRGTLSRRRPEDLLDPRSPLRAPVVLIPGIYETWRFLEPIASRLLDAGHPVHVLPMLGLNHRSIRTMADRTAAYLSLADLRGAVIVAHSKGGLIGKQVMLDEAQAAQESGVAPRVDGMVAINSPFGGSVYATYFPLAAVRALSPAALRALGEQRAVDARITSVFAAWDPHIPGGSELAGATNIRVGALGHFRILGDRATQDTVLAEVERYAATGT
jgi:pimeloyl-ACP methyl ester carboxylesterase